MHGMTDIVRDRFFESVGLRKKFYGCLHLGTPKSVETASSFQGYIALTKGPLNEKRDYRLGTPAMRCLWLLVGSYSQNNFRRRPPNRSDYSELMRRISKVGNMWFAAISLCPCKYFPGGDGALRQLIGFLGLGWPASHSWFALFCPVCNCCPSGFGMLCFGGGPLSRRPMG